MNCNDFSWKSIFPTSFDLTGDDEMMPSKIETKDGVLCYTIVSENIGTLAAISQEITRNFEYYQKEKIEGSRPSVKGSYKA